MHRKRVLMVNMVLWYHFVSRVNRPIYTPKPLFWEHLRHKPMESDFAYILNKLHKNIEQVKYYITVYN